MPGRRKKIFTDGIYHVFNKTINSARVFASNYNSDLFLRTLIYYRSTKARVRFSKFNHFPQDVRNDIFKQITLPSTFKVVVLAYCLMPTHYHLLLHQTMEKGVSKLMNDLINSLTRHVNVKNQSLGPIFLPKFKGVPILNDEQLMHVSRYIHLNPYSGGILTRINQLKNYPWSSFPQYITDSNGICDTKSILKLFENNPSRYEEFVVNSANYQKTLELAKDAEKWI